MFRPPLPVRSLITIATTCMFSEEAAARFQLLYRRTNSTQMHVPRRTGPPQGASAKKTHPRQ